MPRFFIDLHQGHTVCDEEGRDFPDEEAAVQDAKRSAGGVAADLINAGGDQHGLTIVVSDAARKPIYTATVSFFGARLT